MLRTDPGVGVRETGRHKSCSPVPTSDRHHHSKPGMRPPRDSMHEATTYRTVARQPGQPSRSAPTANHKLNAKNRFFKD
ncbi:MAG: hypothetical protein H8E37_09230 [Planctomycetes bacterium]|nr:hypothetical protein [Planctomycetota bacterium]